MWDLFLSGGPVMWPLLLCSIISLTVLLERVWFWLQLDLDKDKPAIEALLEGFLSRKKEGGPARESKSIVFRMLASGIAHQGFSSTKAMEAVALDAVKSMRRGMPVLDTIITIAPMLGILGTVLGIISSFDMLGQAGVEEPKAVVAGIAEALITTAAGLSISVATVFPFNYFNSRIENAQDTLEHYGTRLEIILGSSSNTKTEPGI
jgi:Biopolymer transport proteins